MSATPDHPCAGPTTEIGPVMRDGPFCIVGCPKCGATCQINPKQDHAKHFGYYAGHLHSWNDA